MVRNKYQGIPFCTCMEIHITVRSRGIIEVALSIAKIVEVQLPS